MDTQEISKPFHLPYSEDVVRLLSSIFDALSDLCEARDKETECKPLILNSHFMWLIGKKRGKNPHLFEALGRDSLRTSDGNTPKHRTRISDLLKRTFDHYTINQGTLAALPSPLKILLDYLTIPTEPASRAYGFVTIRTMLFEITRLWPSYPSKDTKIPEKFTRLTYEDVKEELRIIKTQWEKRDTVSLKNPKKALIYHFLAMLGLMDLRFENQGLRLKYCKNKNIFSDQDNINIEFKIRPEVQTLPQIEELMNQLWGIPLPIRGAETIFFGGLRFSLVGGLVAAISGGAGSGKTSLALGLSATLAPIGAKTIYITPEEDPDDLELRRATLSPDYLIDIDFKYLKENFRAFYLPPRSNEKPSWTIPRTAIEAIKTLQQQQKPIGFSGIPLPCPLIVVIDGIQSYLNMTNSETTDEPDSIISFVDCCRKLGALVILCSADEMEELTSLQYLVDIVIYLEHRYTDDPAQKPLRVIHISKTRHQISRQGAHIIHSSGEHGIRITPQLPSQLDRRALFKVTQPDTSYFIDVLNRRFHTSNLDDESLIKRYLAQNDDGDTLKIYLNSQILVYGYGSSGKAGFGLKLLVSPAIPDKEKDKKDKKEIILGAHHRVLILSFLYPKEYYLGLLKDINLALDKEYREILISGEQNLFVPEYNIDVIYFYPGYLNPEDFLSKIIQKLEQADLEGHPYDGIMIDGLHNVFLQFPRLENNPMIWPMLFNILRRRNLTTVTTHTTISLGIERQDTDYELSLRESRPLLHAIVQAVDFFFDIGEPKTHYLLDKNEAKNQENRITIFVRSALKQQKLKKSVYWSREKLIVFDDQPRQGSLLND